MAAESAIESEYRFDSGSNDEAAAVSAEAQSSPRPNEIQSLVKPRHRLAWKAAIPGRTHLAASRVSEESAKLSLKGIREKKR